MLVKRLAVLIGCLFVATAVAGKKNTETQRPEVTREKPQDHQVQLIKQYFNGHKVLISYREGGPLYGTDFLAEIHFCPSGQYISFGQSYKQTILDNVQENNWEEYGQWEVISFQGQATLQFLSTSGERNFLPIPLLPDGRVWIGDGVSIERQGRAQCR